MRALLWLLVMLGLCLYTAVMAVTVGVAVIVEAAHDGGWLALVGVVMGLGLVALGFIMASLAWMVWGDR